MKITRKQLRRLIKESILNEMPSIKPGGEIVLDDEGYGKLTDLSLSDDPMNQEAADELASVMGYEGESFSSDMKHYEEQPGSIMIQQELDDLSVEVGLPSGRYERKIFSVEEIKKDLIDYLHFELLTSSVLDPMKFTHPIPPELKGELLDAIKLSLQSAMSQGGMSLEQMAEEMMDYLLGMQELPEKFYEEDYSLKDDYAKEIKKRYASALRELAGL